MLTAELYAVNTISKTICNPSWYFLCTLHVDINTLDHCRFWGITSDIQWYHVVLLLASVWLSAFIQLCQVESTSKFLRHMTSYSNVLEHSALRQTCSRTAPAYFLCLAMLQWTCDQHCCHCTKLTWSHWGSTSSQLWVELLWDYCQVLRKARNTLWSRWHQCVWNISRLFVSCLSIWMYWEGA